MSDTSKPLSATLGERAPQPFLTLLSDKKQGDAPPRRPPGTRRVVLDAKELWPPPKPDRSQVAPPEPPPPPPRKLAEPVAPKKKTRAAYDDSFKARVVARVRAAKQTGSESVQAIADDLGIHRGNIDNWVKAGKAKRTAGPAKKKASRRAPTPANGSDLAALTRDLDAALANVSAIKKALRAMLEDE